MLSAARERAAQLRAIAPRDMLSHPTALRMEIAAPSAREEPVAKDIPEDDQLVEAAAICSKTQEANGTAGLALVESNGEILQPVSLLYSQQEARSDAMPEKSTPTAPAQQEGNTFLPFTERAEHNLTKFTGQHWQGCADAASTTACCR